MTGTKPTLVTITPAQYEALKRLTISAEPPERNVKLWLYARQDVAKWIDEVVTPAMAAREDME